MQQFRYLSRGAEVSGPRRDLPGRRGVEAASVPLATASRLRGADLPYWGGRQRRPRDPTRERPEAPRVQARYTAEGRLADVRDVIVATTNASLFAYVADAKSGLFVLQLTSPESQPRFYGFSPEPRPEIVAWRRTDAPALSLSRPLERDRAVDETGQQSPSSVAWAPARSRSRKRAGSIWTRAARCGRSRTSRSLAKRFRSGRGQRPAARKAAPAAAKRRDGGPGRSGRDPYRLEYLARLDVDRGERRVVDIAEL